MTCPVSVVILTFNEEKNLPRAVESVLGWAQSVWILDSFSTDGTESLARRYGCQFVQRRFDSFPAQRNFAIQELLLPTDWMFFLDADEAMTPELKEDISRVLACGPRERGFYVKRRVYWLGRWLRRGYYPTWLLRLFHRRFARCEDRPVNEHVMVSGPVGRLRHDIVHDDAKGVAEWVRKHSAYAKHEARALKGGGRDLLPGSLLGGQDERKRWIRRNVWERLPPLVRPLLYFIYRYVWRGGFLEGRAAFTYHFLQALWYPMLIDIYAMEEGIRKNEEPAVERPCVPSPG